jgi:hypothetical protein
MNINYIKTLDKCEEVKLKLEELSVLLHSNVNQELSQKFEDKRNDIQNWIEEIEFTINNYEQN